MNITSYRWFFITAFYQQNLNIRLQILLPIQSHYLHKCDVTIIHCANACAWAALTNAGSRQSCSMLRNSLHITVPQCLERPDKINIAAYALLFACPALQTDVDAHIVSALRLQDVAQLQHTAAALQAGGCGA